MTSVKCPSSIFLKPATFSPVQIELRMTAYCFWGSNGIVSFKSRSQLHLPPKCLDFIFEIVFIFIIFTLDTFSNHGTKSRNRCIKPLNQLFSSRQIVLAPIDHNKSESPSISDFIYAFSSFSIFSVFLISCVIDYNPTLYNLLGQ